MYKSVHVAIITCICIDHLAVFYFFFSSISVYEEGFLDRWPDGLNTE